MEKRMKILVYIRGDWEKRENKQHERDGKWLREKLSMKTINLESFYGEQRKQLPGRQRMDDDGQYEKDVEDNGTGLNFL